MTCICNSCGKTAEETGDCCGAAMEKACEHGMACSKCDECKGSCDTEKKEGGGCCGSCS